MTAFLVEREDQAPIRELEARAIDALLVCLARQGLRKTTLEDVAREAGCGRATLYRYFAGKQAIVNAAVDAEARRVTAALHAAAADTDTLEDAVVALLTTARSELSDHPALRFLADFEPERLLPHLAFTGGDRFLTVAADALAPALAPYVGPEQAPRAGEWIARVGLCLFCAPISPVPLDDEATVRDYAREFIVPAITAPEPQVSIPTTRR